MLSNKSIFSDSHGNALRLSSVLQADQEVHFQNVSAKFVVSGNEKYSLNNRKIAVKNGEYVIGNKNTSSTVLIDSSSPVKGICIDISKEIITEIIYYNYENSDPFSEFLFEQEWMVQKFNSNDTALGYKLIQLSNIFENLSNGSTQVNKELFYTVAECIVKDQSTFFKSFGSLKSVKAETNGRLFTFVYDAKNYIDDHFLEKINLETIAREAKLSEYHFIRLFKTVFNTTPYKYIIQKRLKFALELLQNHYSISEITLLLGYTDVSAFSNAFKQHFGFSPKYIKIN
jgi:AraC family transcriptional regulator